MLADQSGRVKCAREFGYSNRYPEYGVPSDDKVMYRDGQLSQSHRTHLLEGLYFAHLCIKGRLLESVCHVEVLGDVSTI